MAPSGPRARDELDRLRRVYDAYDADASNQRRWGDGNAGNRAIHDERSRAVDAVLASARVPGPVLDLGCGSGRGLARLAPVARGRAVGVDLSGRRLAEAAGSLPTVPFVCADGTALPFADGTFSAALAFTVFSSVLDERTAVELAAELARVLRPGGRLLWYDLRRANPANRAVRPWRRRAVAALFPGWRCELLPMTLLPPLARSLGPATAAAYRPLSRLRPLTTHYFGTLTRPGPG